jgi:hypothetical protein
MTHRQAFVVRVEPGGTAVTVEDVRGGRAARVGNLAEVGTQIDAWLVEDQAVGEAEPQPETDSAGASPQSCSNR